MWGWPDFPELSAGRRTVLGALPSGQVLIYMPRLFLFPAPCPDRPMEIMLEMSTLSLNGNFISRDAGNICVFLSWVETLIHIQINDWGVLIRG